MWKWYVCSELRFYHDSCHDLLLDCLDAWELGPKLVFRGSDSPSIFSCSLFIMYFVLFNVFSERRYCSAKLRKFSDVCMVHTNTNAFKISRLWRAICWLVFNKSIPDLAILLILNKSKAGKSLFVKVSCLVLWIWKTFSFAYFAFPRWSKFTAI